MISFFFLFVSMALAEVKESRTLSKELVGYIWPIAESRQQIDCTEAILHFNQQGSRLL